MYFFVHRLQQAQDQSGICCRLNFCKTVAQQEVKPTCIHVAKQIKRIVMTDSEFVTTERAYLLLELSADRRLGAGEDDDADV